MQTRRIGSDLKIFDDFEQYTLLPRDPIHPDAVASAMKKVSSPNSRHIISTRRGRPLVVSRSLGELEVHTLAGQTLVNLGVGVEAVVDAAALLLVKEDLEDLGAIFLGANTLSNNLDGEDEVGEDGVVHGGEGSAARSLLGLSGAAAVAALRAGENATRGNDDDVAVGELLLELTGQSLLAAVPSLEKRNRDEDDDGLATVSDLDL